jgi:two-component system alkaline phosphatase synthesis response regulator PhoP
MARVKVHLRVYSQLNERQQEVKELAEKADDIRLFGDLVIDSKRHEIRRNDHPLQLKPKEYDLLCYLIDNQGRAVTRERVLEEVWGWDYTGDSRTVDVHVRWLRSKIERDPASPARIVTVPGIGYRFEG